MNVINALNILGRRINRWYPTINHGGCCVFAVLVAEELLKRNIPVEIIVAADAASGNIDRAREQVNSNRKDEWNAAGIYFNHVGIEFIIDGNVYHFETEHGVNPEDVMLGCREVYEGRLSVPEAKELADEAEGWNECFDRKQIPSLRNHVRLFMAANLPVPA